MTAGLVCVVVANTFGQIKLNAWHGAFYDALEQRSLPGIGTQVGQEDRNIHVDAGRFGGIHLAVVGF